MITEYLSSGGVARLLNVPLYKVSYLLSTMAVAEPATRVAGKRLWNPAEVAALAKVLKCQTTKKLKGDR